MYIVETYILHGDLSVFIVYIFYSNYWWEHVTFISEIYITFLYLILYIYKFWGNSLKPVYYFQDYKFLPSISNFEVYLYTVYMLIFGFIE